MITNLAAMPQLLYYIIIHIYYYRIYICDMVLIIRISLIIP